MTPTGALADVLAARPGDLPDWEDRRTALDGEFSVAVAPALPTATGPGHPPPAAFLAGVALAGDTRRSGLGGLDGSNARLRELLGALTGPDRANEQITKRDHLAVIDDPHDPTTGRALLIGLRHPLTHPSTRLATTGSATASAAGGSSDGPSALPRITWDQLLERFPRLGSWPAARATAQRCALTDATPMSELRSWAARLGVAPAPRRKQDLLRALWSVPDLAAAVQDPSRWPLTFTGDRDAVLVLRALSGPTRDAIGRLVDAADAGALAVGDPVTAPHGDVFLYDARDEHPDRARDRQQVAAYLTALEPTRDRLVAGLRQAGYDVYHLGGAHRRADGQDWFYLNASRDRRSVYGWYSVAELEQGPPPRD